MKNDGEREKAIFSEFRACRVSMFSRQRGKLVSKTRLKSPAKPPFSPFPHAFDSPDHFKLSFSPFQSDDSTTKVFPGQTLNSSEIGNKISQVREMSPRTRVYLERGRLAFSRKSGGHSLGAASDGLNQHKQRTHSSLPTFFVTKNIAVSWLFLRHFCQRKSLLPVP